MSFQTHKTSVHLRNTIKIFLFESESSQTLHRQQGSLHDQGPEKYQDDRQSSPCDISLSTVILWSHENTFLRKENKNTILFHIFISTNMWNKIFILFSCIWITKIFIFHASEYFILFVVTADLRPHLSLCLYIRSNTLQSLSQALNNQSAACLLQLFHMVWVSVVYLTFVFWKCFEATVLDRESQIQV